MLLMWSAALPLQNNIQHSLPRLTALSWLWSDYVSLFYTPGNGSKGEDLYVLPRGAFTGEVFEIMWSQCKNSPLHVSLSDWRSFVVIFRWSVSRMSPPFTEYPSCWKNRGLWTTSASVWICLWSLVPGKCSQSGKRWLTGVKIFHSEMFLFKSNKIFQGTSHFRSDRLLEHVTIALVGKYTKLADSYTSVIKALEHSALAINHKLKVKVLIIFKLIYVCFLNFPLNNIRMWILICVFFVCFLLLPIYL